MGIAKGRSKIVVIRKEISSLTLGLNRFCIVVGLTSIVTLQLKRDKNTLVIAVCKYLGYNEHILTKKSKSPCWNRSFRRIGVLLAELTYQDVQHDK